MEFQGSSTTKDVDVQEFWRTTQGQPVWEPPRSRRATARSS